MLCLEQNNQPSKTMINLGEEMHNANIYKNIRENNQDFPDGPVAKTLYSLYRGPRFDPRSGN